MIDAAKSLEKAGTDWFLFAKILCIKQPMLFKLKLVSPFFMLLMQLPVQLKNNILINKIKLIIKTICKV
jgi:hypothetical protein